MVEIPGSEKRAFRNARIVAPAPSDERLVVTLRIRPKNPLPNAQDMLKLSKAPLKAVTHDQYDKLYGADENDLALVRKFAEENNLSVVRESPARRTVILSGTVSDFTRAFGVSLNVYAHANGTYRGRVGSVKIPAELSPIVDGVFGLDNRPVARRHASRPRATDGATVQWGATCPNL